MTKPNPLQNISMNSYAKQNPDSGVILREVILAKQNRTSQDLKVKGLAKQNRSPVTSLR